MTLKEYQKLLVQKLQNVYPEAPIESEWSAMRGDKSLYCPRIDVAVGPFAVNDKKCI